MMKNHMSRAALLGLSLMAAAPMAAIPMAATSALAQESAAPLAALTPLAPQAQPVAGLEVRTTLSLGTGPAETSVVRYDCGTSGTFAITYVNVEPNALALIPVEDDTRLFVTTLSASGARYVSGPFEWWSKGEEATLRNLATSAEAPPLLTCKALPASDATAR